MRVVVGQWLRSFNGAVVFQRRKRRRDCNCEPDWACFNGAVVFQRRKRQRDEPSSNRHRSLQWGRRLSTTETRLNVVVKLFHKVASMGPSSFNDGNRPPPKPFEGLELQAGLRGVASQGHYRPTKTCSTNSNLLSKNNLQPREVAGVFTPHDHSKTLNGKKKSKHNRPCRIWNLPGISPILKAIDTS